MKYKYLLFDNDGTIMDFEKAEKFAFIDTFNQMKFPVEYNESYLKSYSKCNERLWKKLELGLCTKDELIVDRFKDFLQENNLQGDASIMNELYREYLSCNNQLIDGALELLKKLSKTFSIYIITNGVASTQHRRIDVSPISAYISGLFISEETGFAKPDAKYFEYVLKKANIKNKSECIVIGDSLSSDIKGANNFGVDCIWYNPKCEDNKNMQITYEVQSLAQIEKILLNK